MPTPPSFRWTSLAGARARRDWYALEERHAAMVAGRVIAIGVIAVALLTPWLDLTPRERAVAVAGCLAALVTHAALRWLPGRWPRTLRTAVDAGLVVDALLILLLAYQSGGVTSSALWLLPLFCLAATLAVSVRTGVKAIVLSALVATGLQVIDGVDEGTAEAIGQPLLLSAAVVVVAGTLTAVNERELRRRGERMTALHEASSAFVATDDLTRLTDIAGEAASALLPEWDVTVRLDGASATERTWREAGRVALEMPVVAGERAETPSGDTPLGAIAASRPVPRAGRATVRAQQLLALRTLATALGETLVRVDLVRRLEHLSLVDPLTGLGNRRAFDEALRAELARAQRTSRPVSLVMLDVDHFKMFNDRHGHLAGDDALAEVARVLSDAARAEDRACRIGGEEFALLLPGADEASAAEVAERVRRSVEDRHGPFGQITVSLGVAAWEARRPLDNAGLRAAADARLYAAKAGGRNRVVAATPTEPTEPTEPREPPRSAVS
jgi:diguanylate cyclase (GGDEF)-like protein